MLVAPAAVVALLALLLTAGPDRDASRPPGSWPLDGPLQVVRAFSPPPRPWLAGHRGVDLLAAAGSPVRSPISGRVEFVGTVVDRGVVVIRSGGIRVTLEPVRATLAVGDAVRVAQPVGLLEAGPSHCAPAACLHWGLRVGGTYHDPLLLVQRYRAVLLP